MFTAAREFLDEPDAGLQRRVLYPLEDVERLDWYYVPARSSHAAQALRKERPPQVI